MNAENGKRVLDFIVQYKKQYDGVSPTMREIMKGCNLFSMSTVSYHLERLEKNGRIKRIGGPGASRNITVIGGNWQPPTIASA